MRTRTPANGLSNPKVVHCATNRMNSLPTAVSTSKKSVVLTAHCVPAVGGTCLPFPSQGTWLSVKTKSEIKSYACRYSFLCTGGTRPVAASGQYADNHDQTCVNSAGLTLHLDIDGDKEWCLRGWSSNAPLCEDARVQPKYKKDYFLVATVASKCPNSIKSSVFTAFCWIILLLCFFLINDVLRPNYRVLDIVLEIYQVCFCSTSDLNSKASLTADAGHGRRG